ncbi:cytochrome P450 2B11-like isoform X2 [Tachypleus tridentatus]|uniref:cytochrome P450 2B11-like isoform X2 n=1 Tax=Tachypleus tridentatus TaxID=6853 RepID=UPI003FD5F17C
MDQPFLKPPLGIIQDEGKQWQKNRRFTLHTLRDFGFGKLSLEGRIQEITKDILNTLRETKEMPYDVSILLANSTANVICSLMFDKHYDHQNPEFIKLRNLTQKFLYTLPGVTALIPMSYMKYLPSFLFPTFNTMSGIKKEFHEFVGNIIREHESTFQETNLRDYVDVYLEQKYRAENEGRTIENTFIVERLKAISLNMFLAGTETTSNTLYWGMKLMTLHQDIQDRIYKEIVEVVGKERLPSTADRNNMPYTEAAIMEIQRFSNLVPLGIAHTNPGKRICLGEALAKMELFLFFTAVLQQFHIKASEGRSQKLWQIYQHSSLTEAL